MLRDQLFPPLAGKKRKKEENMDDSILLLYSLSTCFAVGFWIVFR